jgi:ABC-type Fe3+ transport system substrate-binding protein
MNQIDKGNGLFRYYDKEKINLAVFPSCAIKVGMTEMIRRFVEVHNRNHKPKIEFNMMEHMDIRKYKEELIEVQNSESYPDIILDCGYGVLFQNNFLQFAKEGIFEDVLLNRPKSQFYEQNVVQDPNNVYSVLGASMSVIIIDHTLMGDLPIPKSFKELLNPIYKGKVVIHGHGDSSCDMGIILRIYNLYGEKGVLDFTKNLQRLLHFAEVAKNIGKASKDSAAISIMPESTIKFIQNTEKCSVIWPRDGSPIFPLLMTVKKSKVEQASKLIEFLSGEQMGKFLAQSFFASPHINVKNRDYFNKNSNCLAWDQVSNLDFKKTKDDLEVKVLDIIRNQMSEEMKASIRGNKAIC